MGGDWRYTVSFAGGDEYVEWLNGMKASSLVETDTDITSESDVIILSTCVGGNSEQRTVVAAILRES
ncbi:MAG: hypothetical protein VB092_08025 [Oscillospiraceae bacterium]|nr:hypothetical protein [Oscillospiraceae bacterium]